MPDVPQLPTMPPLDPDEVAVLQRAGALSVRPGFQVSGGWFTGRRALVVTVPQKEASPPPGRALPRTLGGLAVDVRQASARKQQALLDPEAYDAEYATAPAHLAVAEFPDEQLVTPEGLVAAPALAAARPAKPQVPYTPPPGVALTPVQHTVTLTLSASPDSGWPVLREFLQATTTHLSVAMYDFTSAHVLATLRALLPGKTLDLVLDRPSALNPTAEQTDETTVIDLHADLGDRLSQAWALTDTDPHATAWVFPNAYHIKVAVRDHTSVWLSSGNWNNSNQPDIDPVTNPADAQAARVGDRDWHVVIEHPGLAAVFEAVVSHDLSVAAAHQDPSPLTPGPPPPPPGPGSPTPPYAGFAAPLTLTEAMTITPVLTPDPADYTDAIKTLIAGATATLYMQFQYIHVPQPPAHPSPTHPAPDNTAFMALIDAVIERQNAGIDVRIIMSEWENQDYLDQLITAGLDVAHHVKIQNNVHNKGVIVDSHTVLVSSQNWSSDGVLRNRDAGVVIAQPDVAGYFQARFLHDWDHLAAAQAHDG